MTTPASLRNLRNDSSTPSTSRWRRARSTANMFEQFQQPASTSQKPAPAPEKKTSTPPPPKPAAKLERASSKMSLFNLFSRPKVEKARGHIEVGLAVPMRPQTPPKPAPASPPKSALRQNPPPAAQQLARSRSSQLLRPMSSMSLRPSAVKTEKVESDHWSPPPLFQVYPQSIKHATVQACVYSPDVLIRTQSQRKQYEAVRERMDSHRDLSAIMENGADVRKLEKSHRRLVSNSIMNPTTPQLTNKVYVLVTSGYILQYSGDGPFDRLPEKVLKLGKESAAFACDLIPGKHWVLQISQCASDDGTVAIGPKSTLLSRLRLQNSSARRAATTFLLVLESPDEMNAWMSAIRKEIDNQGGGKPKDEAERESTSTEESEKHSQDNASVRSHRYQVQRDPKRISKMIDSPLQSQYSDSPKIVASDWEGTRSEKTVSIVGSASTQSSRRSTKRDSVEVSSIATTPMSQDQLQLDQLRERSRHSYVSTATTVSGTGTGTRNTSRNSSPAPTSPLKEGFATADTEPLRSATSLRSFHMNPGNTITTRRRSMQPLPVTNEDPSLSAVTTSITPQRHSVYGPISPTSRKPDDVPMWKAMAPSPAPTADHDPSPAPSTTPSTTPTPTPSAVPEPVLKSQLAPLLINPTPRLRYSTQVPPRSFARSSSAPPARYGTISPPPREPAPKPPGRPQSTIGALASATPTSTSQTSHRLSTGAKPFMRPFPVRPQAQHMQQRDSAYIIPKRMSSLGPAPMALGVAVTPSRSVTAPVRPPSVTAGNPDPVKGSPPQPQLRRPNSVQIRSDHAPFLSSSRPTAGSGPIRRVVSSTPSFLPGSRASTTITTTSSPVVQPGPPISTLKQQAREQTQLMQERGIVPRRSMPVLGLPPPAPPPDMPLPPPPPMAGARGIAV